MKGTKFVLDSYSLICLFEEERGYQKILRILESGRKGELVLLLSEINWGEIYYIISRTHDEKRAEDSLIRIEDLPILIKEVNRELILNAAKIKSTIPISYADAFVAALALQEQASIITGDREFESLENKIPIIWI